MIRYLSLFSGIGAFEKALDNLGIPYELLAYCEVDKYASKAYSLLHHVPESMNLGDITKVDEKALPTDIDLLTYGFPCQDISIAGNKRGFVNEDGTKTRSGLFFDALRIIEHCKPKVAIAENVKNLTSKSMSSIFSIVLESLDNAGYNCYWQVLNSADYGVPQGRERVFIVSIRKDVDDHSFQFPPTIPLEMCMGDLLDEEVPTEFYLSEEKTQSVIRHDSNHPGHIADRGGGREVKVLINSRYRKLTPKEYFRLMGFSDSDYELLAMNGISKTQIYKMAGNSIVVTVLEHLFKQIYKPDTQSIDSLKKKSLDILNTL